MRQGDIIRLIVIEESANDAEMILNSLRKARFPIRPKHVEDEEDLLAALSEQEWDLIISVPEILDFTVQRAAELVKTSKQDIPIIALIKKFSDMTALLAANIHSVIPRDDTISLQYVVRKELDDLETRLNLRHMEQLYRQSQQQNVSLLETSRDAISYVHEGMHIHANPSYLEMFGYKDMEELEGMPVMDLVAPEDHAKFKEFMREYMIDENEEDRDIELVGFRINQNKRQKFKLKLEVSKALYDNEKCIQIIIREQLHSKEIEQKLKEKFSRLDTLTGLINRQHFMQLLDKALSKAMESHTRSLVLFMRLDNFTEIRQRVGIGGSDPIVINVANALKEALPNVVISRFGDVAFTFLLHDKDLKHAQAFGHKVLKIIEGCVTELENQSVVTTCSIGIAQVLASAGTPQSILSDAHAASKVAEKNGGNQIEVYKAVVKASDNKDAELNNVAKMIETGIEEKRFSLVYQPIVSLRGEEEEIFEVLLRMVDANGKNVPPGMLFAAAEKAGLTLLLDKWVLREAVHVVHDRGGTKHNTHLFIKLSDQAIKDSEVLIFIKKLLKLGHVTPEHLTIEISEATAISQIKFAKAFITRLKQMGCKAALEHFGTGLNSETTLKHLPVDYVKIDSSYAKGLSSNAEHQTSVKKIVELAHSFNKSVIAEAVEDANSLTVLFQSEVDFAQGHYIQEPDPRMEYDFTG